MVHPNFVIFQWKPPRDPVARFEIEAKVGGEFQPLFEIPDPESIGIRARVDPQLREFRLYCVSEDGIRSEPVTAQVAYPETPARIAMTEEQKTVLVDFFERSQNPTRAEREDLSAALHLPLSSITFWFQNARRRSRATMISDPHL
jgi:hypothetical protein